MRQYGEIEIDEAKLTVGDLLEVLMSNCSTPSILTFAEKAVVGGIKDLPITEFSKVLTAVMRYMHDNTQEIAIAIASMNNYLKGDE